MIVTFYLIIGIVTSRSYQEKPLKINVRNIPKAKNDANLNYYAYAFQEGCFDTQTKWTPCSSQCGWGYSERMTFTKTCEHSFERRFCYLKDCHVRQKMSIKKKCTRAKPKSKRERLRIDNCVSVRPYRLRTCNTCEPAKVCSPSKIKTATVKFKCHYGSQKYGYEVDVVRQKVAMTRQCRCRKKSKLDRFLQFF